jgi:hypothetical protein
VKGQHHRPGRAGLLARPRDGRGTRIRLLAAPGGGRGTDIRRCRRGTGTRRWRGRLWLRLLPGAQVRGLFGKVLPVPAPAQRTCGGTARMGSWRSLVGRRAAVEHNAHRRAHRPDKQGEHRHAATKNNHPAAPVGGARHRFPPH